MPAVGSACRALPPAYILGGREPDSIDVTDIGLEREVTEGDVAGIELEPGMGEG